MRRLTRDRRRGDSGSTLLSVVVIMLVLMVVALTTAAVTVNTTRSLVSTRTVASARAAADAGMAALVAHARRTHDFCNLTDGDVVRAGNAPSYEVSSTACDANKVTFTSVGHPGSSAPATIKAVYSYTIPMVAGPSASADGALVSGKGAFINVSSIQVLEGGDFELANGGLDCNGTSTFSEDVTVRNGAVSLNINCAIGGSIYIENGTLLCTNNATVAGDVIVRKGKATIDVDCAIGGRIFVDDGDFECKVRASVKSVMVRTGTSKLYTNCRIEEDLVSHGSVSMSGASKVGGNVLTNGTYTLDAATVLGSVRAAGTFNIQNYGTVAGELASASSGTSKLYNATIGSARIGGNLESTMKATVNGVAEVAGTGYVYIDPATTGTWKFAGTYGYWGTPKFTAAQGVPNLTAPSVTLPTSPTTPTTPTFSWSDYPFVQSKWEGAGYTYFALPNTDKQCSVQSWQSTLLATLEGFPGRTVVDARACAELNLYNATLSLRTDLAIITNGVYAQGLVIKSGDDAKHLFSLIRPDGVEDGSPTCSPDHTMKLPGVSMSEKISGIAYSPCGISLGNLSGSRWNGQIYAGVVNWGGSGILMKLYYQPVDLPGLGSPAGGGGGGGGGGESPGEKTLDSLISQWDG